MNKNSKILRLPTKHKNNKTLGYLPLDFDDTFFKQFMSKYKSLHPYAQMIASYALYDWNRKSDEVVENGVTKNFFDGDYSNIYFHKNLETIIRELKFTFSEGRPRNIVPVWLFMDMTQSTYGSMKATRYSNNETLNSNVVQTNNDNADRLTSFTMQEMTFNRLNTVFPCEDMASTSNKYFPDNVLFDGSSAHQSRMLSLIPYNPFRITRMTTLLPDLKNFNEQNNFISMVFNNDAIDKNIPIEIVRLGPEYLNPSRFIRDLITVYSFYRLGTMSYTQPLYHTFPQAMWENIDLFSRGVYANSFKASVGDQSQVKQNSYIYEMFDDASSRVVNNNTVSYGQGRKITYAPSLARARLKPMNFLITVLEQARDFLKWAESDQFPVEFRSNFDSSKTANNEEFIQSQLQFMNSMSDTVQKELINDKIEWQQKKDELSAEIEAKNKALNEAIEAKRVMVKNLVNAKSLKDTTIKNYVTELEKRYITE